MGRAEWREARRGRTGLARGGPRGRESRAAGLGWKKGEGGGAGLCGPEKEGSFVPSFYFLFLDFKAIFK
jgi:hypothetical protein